MDKVYLLEDRARIAEILATKKYNDILQRGKTKNKFEIQGKITNFLIGRGFDFDTISKAVDEAFNTIKI